MCNKFFCKLVGFVAVCLVWMCLTGGCSSDSSDSQSLPSQGGGAGSSGGMGGSSGSLTGGNAGASAEGGAGGATDAGLGGGAGQTDSAAGEDVSDDAESDASIEADAGIVCPGCDELLAWDTTQYKHSAYGKLSTSATWDDSYAWQMLNACAGWSIVDGHEGGLGDTLEIGTCNDGVVLVWAYDMFSSVRLGQGWTGKTDKDLAIGSSYQDFVQAYPDYTGNSTTLDVNGYASLSYANGLAIFKNSVLFQLTVW